MTLLMCMNLIEMYMHAGVCTPIIIACMHDKSAHISILLDYQVYAILQTLLICCDMFISSPQKSMTYS